MPTLFLLAEARVVKSKVLTLVRPIKQYKTTLFVSPLKQELKKGMPIGAEKTGLPFSAGRYIAGWTRPGSSCQSIKISIREIAWFRGTDWPSFGWLMTKLGSL